MNKNSTFYLFLSVTFLVIFGTILLIGNQNRPKTLPIGPHEVVNWHSGYIAQLNGDMYVLEDDHYFALTSGTTVLQSKYKEPEIGEEKGSYYYPVSSIEGTWTLEGSVDIYSLEPGQITFTSTSAEKFIDGFLCSLLGIIAWLILTVLIAHYDDM